MKYAVIDVNMDYTGHKKKYVVKYAVINVNMDHRPTGYKKKDNID